MDYNKRKRNRRQGRFFLMDMNDYENGRNIDLKKIKTDSQNHTYLCIDLKSFYASVECTRRGLNPMVTNLVVADASRTSKTICLAVSPALKAYGIPGRARLFEVEQRIKKANYMRQKYAPGHQFTGLPAIQASFLPIWNMPSTISLRRPECPSTWNKAPGSTSCT